jgi:hypothetical protein
MGSSSKASYEEDEAAHQARERAALAERISKLGANGNRGFEVLREAIDGLRVALPVLRLNQKEWDALNRVIDAWDLKERRLTRS